MGLYHGKGWKNRLVRLGGGDRRGGRRTDLTIPGFIDFTYTGTDDSGEEYTLECSNVKVLCSSGEVFADSSLRRLDLSDLTQVDSGRYFYTSLLANCTTLEELILPEDMPSIPEKFCAGCTSLRSVNLPDTVTEIGVSAFEDTALTSVTLPSSLKKLGMSAFRGADLTSIDLPDGLESIGSYCFADTGITELTVPASVKLLMDLERSGMTNSIKDIILEGTDLSKVQFGYTFPKGVTFYIQPGVTVPKALEGRLVLTVGEEKPIYELSSDKSELDFGTVAPFGETRVPQTVTITNTGNATVEKLSFDWKDDWHRFQFTFPDGDMPQTLAPGESFRVNFAPDPTLDPDEYYWDMTIAGSPVGEVHVDLRVKVTEGPGCLFLTTGNTTLDFGTRNVGESGPGNKFVTICNGTDKDVTLTKPQSEYYDIQLPSNPVVKPGSTAYINVKPKVGTSTAGDYSEVLHFDPGNSKADLKVTYVINGGSLSVSPSTLTFDGLQEGYTDQPTRTVTIKNNGTGSLTLNTPRLSGSAFEIADYPTSVLAPGASATMQVRPKRGLSAGDYSGTLDFSATGGLTASVSLRLKVTGASALSSSPAALRFAATPENGTWPAAQTVTLTNSGTETLKLKTPSAKNYTLGALSRTTLSAGQSATFTVQPKAGLKAGTYNETLTIATDQDASAAVSLSFQVTAAGKTDFIDVPGGAYYEDAVAWAAENNITSGTSATTFAPDMVCSRAQTVTFLWRSQGFPKAGANNPFTDVSAGTYYTDAVLWAVEQNITSGTSATTFAPNADCSRGQIVTFLYRCLGE